MSVISEYGQLLIILACLFGFLMAWGVGANDVANAMGTSVGSKALTIKQAIFIAMIFEFAGAYLAGGEVTGTIRKGIVDPSVFADKPELMVYGMMSALLAAGIWLAVAAGFADSPALSGNVDLAIGFELDAAFEARPSTGRPGGAESRGLSTNVNGRAGIRLNIGRLMDSMREQI